MADVKRKHHFVPQFYLKRWGDDDGLLWRFQRANGRDAKPKQKHYAGILYEEHLYTVRGREPGDVFLAEDEVFQEIDSAAAPALEELLATKNISSENRWDALFRFMYTLQVRNPRVIQGLMDESPALERETIKQLEALLGPPILNRRNPSEITDGHSELGRFLAVGIAKLDFTYRDYFNVPWCIRMLPDRLPLMTSDYPFAAMPNFDHPNTVFVFPLAPNACFLGFKDQRMAHAFTGIDDERFCDLINVLTVARAESVYAVNSNSEGVIYSLLGSWESDKERFRMARDAVWRDGVRFEDLVAILPT